MSSVTLGRWGHNLAVRLPSEIVRAVGLADGEQLEITAQDDEILIRRRIAPPTLDALFAGRDPAGWRELYAGAFDWGPDRGREIVEE